MSLNDTPSGERVHIGFFGRRNAGKSSLVNAVTGQALSVVSEVKGTTTDPVRKAMELLPLGPVMIVDTPGFDDSGALGEMRVAATRRVLNTIDLAVLVVDAREGLQPCDVELKELLSQKHTPYLVAYNKSDLAPGFEAPEGGLAVSALTGENIHELKERMARLVPADDGGLGIVEGLVQPGNLVVLVTPIDSAAPKGRMILPQQQTLRAVLDAGAIAVVTRETELSEALAKLSVKPSLVITDSQAFARVSAIVPEDVPLTSFSIQLARVKGLLDEAVRGVTAVERLQDGDRVLIAEGCTHHRQCTDIGTVKIPRWLAEYTGKALNLETCSGHGFPDDLSPYALVIHCGGCMLTPREVRARMNDAKDQGVPITNYGITIAYMQGILRRSVRMFPHLLAQLEGRAE